MAGTDCDILTFQDLARTKYLTFLINPMLESLVDGYIALTARPVIAIITVGGCCLELMRATFRLS